MRSRTGCQTCRLRKLKCDERKPICGPCGKANRECVFNSGLIFRHQQNASMNRDLDGNESGLKGFYAYKNTFDDDAVWLDIPKNVRFWNTTDPYNEPMSPASETASPTATGQGVEQSATVLNGSSSRQWSNFAQSHRQTSAHALHALSAVATGDHFPYLHPPASRQDATPATDTPVRPSTTLSNMHPPTPMARQNAESPISPPVSMTSSNHNIDFILNHPAVASPPLDPTLHSPYAASGRESLHGRSASSRLSIISGMFETSNAETDHEIAYLLRYYSEGPGQWMDLFDLGNYFASYVPIKAQTNPVLKYAAVAYAAKALGRVKGKRPVMGGNAVRKSRTEIYPTCPGVDWYHKATEYYDNAVSLLRHALQEDSRGISHDANASEGTWQSSESHDDGSFGHANGSSILAGFPTSRCNSDELLAATAILCVYEFLDASGPEWARHLSGAKGLIDIAKDSMMPLQLPSPGVTLQQQQRISLSKARKATFWNVARQDMLSAFINACQTRLDTEDLPMWKDAGLQIDDETGFLRPFEQTGSGYPESGDIMKEDMMSNALVWLMSKLVNFMAAGDELPSLPGLEWSQGVPQRTLLDYWKYLRRQFQIWYEGLPITFRACARIAPSRMPGSLIEDDLDAVLPEVWYSLPMCGSTMQSYHMSQVQLLMNKPHETTQGRTTVFARFNSYESAISESQVHSREIVSIALSRPDAAVRINSVQPLYTAGQCLADPRERRLVLKLLKDIEVDTGWATEYRVRQLLDQWEWNEGDVT
ncbi:uncharacterized protein J3D65DRAFT_623048 [Phyllosticta citribraziliensis]|uniref:Zn(2)-C6 fungal-type domain-containing protein n=1 Tax=Phyllosticta citribraziliensis TaxID=989973 RepID=A0ABR1LU93_9PEZI